MWAEEQAGLLPRAEPDPAAARVLVVCDDPTSREELATAFEHERYRVHFAAPASGDSRVGSEFDVAVVDLTIASGRPDVVIRSLRAGSKIPIMAITDVAVAEALLLGAYTAGADQCVNGFARPRELVARVRALLRRNPPRPRAHGATAAADGFAVDRSRGAVVVGETEIALTRPECDILDALIRHAPRVVRREDLVTPGLPAGALDSHVRRLRNKLEAVDQRRRIVVVRGVGFRFDAE